MQLEKGQLLNNRYELLKLVGSGGFSVVWLAHDRQTDLQVVCKIYAVQYGLDEDGLSQFKKEYVRTRDIRHTNLLTPDVFEILEDNKSPFLVMQFCESGSLQNYISTNIEVSESLIADLLVQVGSGLVHLHEKKLLHHDIKPDNILITAEGDFMLTDFGISRKMHNTLNKATRNQSYMTPAYSPPEKYWKKPQESAASDIFSFGVTLYELCTKVLPWDGMGGSMLNAGASIPDLPEEYSTRLNKIIEACMNEQPSARPTAIELVEFGRFYEENEYWPEWNGKEIETQNNNQSTQKVAAIDETETEIINSTDNKVESTKTVAVKKLDNIGKQNTSKESAEKETQKVQNASNSDNQSNSSRLIFSSIAILLIVGVIGIWSLTNKKTDDETNSLPNDPLLQELAIIQEQIGNANIPSIDILERQLSIYEKLSNKYPEESSFESGLSESKTLLDNTLTNFNTMVAEAEELTKKDPTSSKAKKIYLKAQLINPNNDAIKKAIKQIDEKTEAEEYTKKRLASKENTTNELATVSKTASKEATTSIAPTSESIVQSKEGVKDEVLAEETQISAQLANKNVKETKNTNKTSTIDDVSVVNRQKILNDVESTLLLNTENEIVKQLLLGARSNNARSLFDLGVIFEEGRYNIQKNYNTAVKLYSLSAQNDYMRANYRIGILYEAGGYDLNSDLQKAKEYYTLAAEAGYINAQTSLGKLYEKNGTGHKADLEKAREWYLKAAKQYDPVAQTALGILYQQGKGVTINAIEAEKWYKRAIRNNYKTANPLTLTNLAILYSEFEEVKDDAKTLDLLNYAANQEYAKAQYLLGKKLFNGVGINKDEEKAKFWLKKAARLDNEEAKRFLKSIDVDW